MRLITHPGPRARTRADLRPCRAVPLRVTLRKGLTLSQAISDALAQAGFRFGYLRLDGVRLAHMAFVMPAPASDAEHAAWYSATHRRADATILHGGAHLGQRDGRGFVHCHALFQSQEMGHVLCEDSHLARDIQVHGWGLEGAGLVAQPDDETRFTLFRPQPCAPQGQGAWLLTLRPNQDIIEALQQIARRQGIAHARIEGIGSLVGTHFTNATQIDSHATEILLLDGALRPDGLVLSAASVGFGGAGRTGVLTTGANAVCVTAELLMIGLPAEMP